MLNSRNRVGIASLVVGLTIGATGLAGGSSVIADRPSSAPKVIICHATGSESNPYVKIEVARSAINGTKGHRLHTGPVWYPGAKAAGVVWGDIIPPVASITAGLNWPEGEATFLNGDCELHGVNSTSTPKVSICHATGSESNPYVKIKVARSAIHGTKGHRLHTGPVWYPGAKAAGVVWGDIIPPVASITAGLNWPEGEATFLNGDCELPGVNSTTGTVKPTTTTVRPTTTTVRPTTTIAAGAQQTPTGVLPSSGELPATGRDTTGMVLLGAFSVVLGAMLLGVKRKPAVR